MLKFLLYLFLSYVVFRFIFGRLIGGVVKTKVYRYETHNHYHQAAQEKEEGKITIKTKPVNKKPDDKHLGEYVDYEEVK